MRFGIRTEAGFFKRSMRGHGFVPEAEYAVYWVEK